MLKLLRKLIGGDKKQLMEQLKEEIEVI